MSAELAPELARSPAEAAVHPVTDPVGAWFGARVHRTGADTAEVTLPAPAPGTGGSVFARMVQGVDIAAGVAANLAVDPRSALTADLLLHVLQPDVRGDLICRGTMERVGRAQAVAAIEIVDTAGTVVAVGTANHGLRAEALRMYLHDLRPGDTFDLAPYRVAPVGPLTEVFGVDGGIAVSEATTNPWGVAQGALIVTLVESAAAAAGLAHIEDLTVRFLASATVGPVRFVRTAVADRVGTRLLLGELRDDGADRTVCLISAAGPRSEGA